MKSSSRIYPFVSPRKESNAVNRVEERSARVHQKNQQPGAVGALGYLLDKKTPEPAQGIQGVQGSRPPTLSVNAFITVAKLAHRQIQKRHDPRLLTGGSIRTQPKRQKSSSTLRAKLAAPSGSLKGTKNSFVSATLLLRSTNAFRTGHSGNRSRSPVPTTAAGWNMDSTLSDKVVVTQPVGGRASVVAGGPMTPLTPLSSGGRTSVVAGSPLAPAVGKVKPPLVRTKSLNPRLMPPPGLEALENQELLVVRQQMEMDITGKPLLPQSASRRCVVQTIGL